MPALLITGLNGFVAVHVAALFLSKGWDVRGTVRSKAKGDATINLPVLKAYTGRISYTVVEDLIHGDFAPCLEGVDAVAHCASPWHLNGSTWREYRDPAVEGTANILRQAARSPGITAVAMVSSFAAVSDSLKPYHQQVGVVINEQDWLPYDEAFAEQMERDKSPFGPAIWYFISKKYAELTAYETVKQTEANFTLAMLCPPVIFGPAIHLTSANDLEHADVSTATLYKSLIAGKEATLPETYFPAWVDVRTVAQAVYLSIANRATGRYLITDGLFDNQILAKEARKLRPDLDQYIPHVDLSAKTPLDTGSYTLDGTKADEELGLTHITLPTMIGDTLEQFGLLGAFDQ